jgi:beta-glucosidase-like glycosyl hydrolase
MPASATERDPRTLSPRVAALVRDMSLAEKLAQLVGLWAAAKRSDEVVAPMQDTLLADDVNFERFAAEGLGQFTRHYGTRPVEAGAARRQLAARQRWLGGTARGIRAVVHEECLTGVLAWGATAYPTPLAWGATFDPPLIGAMAARIGADLSSLGIHQGLAPVLDVVRDLRWGRVEECISEDPWLVASIGSAYVAGIESAGVVSTLKHFVGYSGSRGGQNHGPVAVGRRELAEVFLPPFELAIREAGARSVMNSYTEVDGIPVASDPDLLTAVLRDEWGFEGTVVADYFAVTFLQIMHAVAGSLGDAAVSALTAGIDVELPTGSAYLAPLADGVERGIVDIALVDRALVRVLEQKEALGLLDGDEPEVTHPIDLDGPENRRLAAEVAEKSIVLLANDGILPVSRPPRTIAIVGPNARSSTGLLGCYSFANHVLPHHPGFDAGIDIPTVAEALIAEFGDDPAFVEARGCDILGTDTAGIPEAVAAARVADVAFVVVGDQSGMFGRGTSGEGCDTADLELPGAQRQLVEAVLDTGTPVVLVLVTGRPYVLDGLVDRAAATVQAFLPGQAGATAIAGVVSGRVTPSGRLPVGIPAAASLQPSGYLHPILGGKTPVSSADPTPRFPFGFGLGHTTFAYGPVRPASDAVPTDGSIELEFELENTGEVAGVEVVQLYAHDPVASVSRPVRWLVGFGRVELAAGETTTVAVRVAAAAFSLVGRDLRRVVEPGDVELLVARDAGSVEHRVTLRLVGPTVEARYPGAGGRVVESC